MPELHEFVTGLTKVLLDFHDQQQRQIAILELMNKALHNISGQLDNFAQQLAYLGDRVAKIDDQMPNPLDHE